MALWLIGVAACCLVWAILWKNNLLLAFGVLIGVLLAWLLSYPLEPYVTGMAEIPVWLPPLPLATVAVILLVYGALVWVRGNDALPKPPRPEHHHAGDHEHHAATHPPEALPDEPAPPAAPPPPQH